MIAALAAIASLLPAQDTPSTAPGSAADAAVQRKTQPTIGVVDLEKAVEMYPKAIAQRERLKAMQEDFKSQIDKISKRIDELHSDATLSKEGTPERERKEFEWSMAAKQREGMAKLFNAQFNRELDRYWGDVYEDLEIAVAEVAKLKGVQLVLRLQPMPPIDGGKDPADEMRQKVAAFDRRMVWFASDEVDLTPALIKYLQVPVVKKPTEKKGDAEGAAPEKRAGGNDAMPPHTNGGGL